MFKKRLIILSFIIFPLVVGTACLVSLPFGSKDTPEPEIIVEPTEEVIQEITEEPEVEMPEETEIPVDPVFFQEPKLLDKSLWVQEDTDVFVSFFLENPNSNVIIEGLEYTVYLYDASGTEIESDYNFLRWMFPNQAVGIVTTFYLSDESVTVDKVDIKWEYDDTISPEGFTDPFTWSNAVYWDNDSFPIVTGIINNVDSDTVTDARVNVLLLDTAGEIVGGGYSYVDFIPGNGYMGFYCYVDAYGDVASVELYPTLTYSTDFIEDPNIFSNITLLDDYFYTGPYDNILGGAKIQNNTSTVLRSSILVATFYDADGNVSATGSEYIDILLPGETLGMAPYVVSPSDEAKTTQYDVMILPGEAITDFELTENPFVVNNTEITGDYDDYVEVHFTNTYSKQVSEVDVYVLLYNADGQIIGGGHNWSTDPTPAGGTAEVEVWVSYADAQTVDKIEAWVVPTYFTTFD